LIFTVDKKLFTSKKENMNNTNKIFTALGIGMAAGAVLGILFAPRKGKETREILSKNGTKLTSTIKNEIHEGQRKLTSMKEGFKESLNHISKKAEEVL
jgi:gas vesicle protein